MVDVVPILLGARWLLVRAEVVSEFLPTTPWLAVPGSTPLVPGVMTWRGRAIPVLDLPRALGLGAIAPQDECSRVMIVEHGVGAVAFPIDGAREVRSISEQEVRPQHASSSPYAMGEVVDPDRVMPLIDLNCLLGDVGKVGT